MVIVDLKLFISLIRVSLEEYDGAIVIARQDLLIQIQSLLLVVQVSPLGLRLLLLIGSFALGLGLRKPSSDFVGNCSLSISQGL